MTMSIIFESVGIFRICYCIRFSVLFNVENEFIIFKFNVCFFECFLFLRVIYVNDFAGAFILYVFNLFRFFRFEALIEVLRN